MSGIGIRESQKRAQFPARQMRNAECGMRKVKIKGVSGTQDLGARAVCHPEGGLCPKDLCGLSDP